MDPIERDKVTRAAVAAMPNENPDDRRRRIAAEEATRVLRNLSIMGVTLIGGAADEIASIVAAGILRGETRIASAERMGSGMSEKRAHVRAAKQTRRAR